MKILLIFGSVIFPVLMFLLQRYQMNFKFIFNLIAIIAALIFGNIASTSIYQVIKENAVFMTNIHGLFLNPLFLITGAYLGVYIVYKLLILTLEDLDTR
ncbi:transposase [Virgibacillus soli]|uniref:Transposase n=1 Tax=Paracerasibacillus soli TaxID=480284 RepID=A0ABU5CRM7_9BACI|nr:transposase [Virgibacillus soli]MDY0408991.1 transposase [Virgibacillus soli]